MRTVLKRLATKAGVDAHLVTPHRLRHYFGLTSDMAGVPATALMRALGHRTPLMTARCSEFADAERRWAFARADITNGMRPPEAHRRDVANRSPGSPPESSGCRVSS